MKIDLSDENVKKTILYDNLLAQNLKTHKKYIGVLITDKECNSFQIILKRYTLAEFKKEFRNRKVLSSHEYRGYLSVAIERLVN